MTTPADAVANPDGPRDWHHQLEELQDKLRTVEINRNQLHSRLTRLMDALGAKTFDSAMAAAAVAKTTPSIPGPVVKLVVSDAQKATRDAVRAHLGAALRRAVEETGCAEFAAQQVAYLMAAPALVVELYRQLTEALYPFGPAGEVPTENGHYDIVNGDVVRAASLYDGKWRVHELRHSDILTSATMTKMAAVTDHFSGLRFAVRPTRKPPTP